MNAAEALIGRSGASARWTTAILLALGAAISVWLNFPGHMSYDSVVQLAEGRAGAYGLSGHPPVMSWLLGLADAVMPGPALFVLFDTVLIGCAMVSLVLLGRRVSWISAMIAAGISTFPQLVIYPSIVWKDVLFAGAATAGFACLANAATRWETPRWRHAFCGLGLVLLILAALARQNGIVILPFAAIAVVWIAAISPSSPGIGRAILHGVAYLAAGLAITAGASGALTPHNTAPTAAVRGQFGNLQTYDMVRALALSPNTKMRVLRARAPWFERLLRQDGVTAFSPVRIDSLEPVMERAGEHPDSTDLIAAQWKDMFLRDPWLYLRVRADAFRWVLMPPSQEDCVLILTGVDGPPEEMAALGLITRKTRQDDRLADYALWFASTPIYSHAAYGVVALSLMVGLVVRRRAADIAVAAMLAGALAFTAAFAVISIACDYRYLYDLDLAAIAASLYVAATWRDAQHGQDQARHRPKLST